MFPDDPVRKTLVLFDIIGIFEGAEKIPEVFKVSNNSGVIATK
jgi:hypothetical protein